MVCEVAEISFGLKQKQASVIKQCGLGKGKKEEPAIASGIYSLMATSASEYW